jgi:phosphoglucomutase
MGLSKVGDFVKWIIEGLKSTFKSGAMRQILVNVGIVSGIGTGVEYLKDVVKTKKEMAKLDKEKQKEEEESLEDLGVALSDKEVDMSPLLKVT